MNNSSRRVVIFILLVAVAAASCSSGSNVPAARRSVEDELSAGARSFQAKDFDEAYRHFQKALDLDPKNPKAAILLARVLDSQYRRDDPSTDNVFRGEKTLDAYRRVLALDPNNDEAAGGVFALLGFLDRKDELLKFAAERAGNPAVTPERRAETYTFLASKQWDCAFTITELSENKQVVERKDGATVIQYKKPKDQADYDRAIRCMTEGMETIERAIALNPNSAIAWSYKTNLLLEARKLAQMDGKADRQADYARQADEASARARELSAHKEEEAARAFTTETGFDSLVPPVDHSTLTLVSPEEPPIPEQEPAPARKP